jgi:hypothetical protein
MSADLGQALRAVHRAAGLRGLAVHAFVFAAAFGLAWLTGGERTYFWPFVGWTFGILLHGVAALGPGQFLQASWEEERLRSALAGDAPEMPARGKP